MGNISVEDLFLILAVIFAIAMIILMIKYANFIHSQPKMEAERKKMSEGEADSHEKKSIDNQ